MTARRLIALLSALFLFPLIAVTTATQTASAADGARLFTPMPGFTPSALSDASVRPSQFKAYRADLAGLRAQLAGGRTTLTIPDPAGTPTEFSVVEDSVMEPGLQAAHPDIRTYAGAAANGTTIRLDVTPLGFHAMVRRPDGVDWYVEPATRTVGEDRVLSFAGALAGDAPTFVEQEVRGAAHDAADSAAADPTGGTDVSTPGGIVTQRTYRLALVTDPNYANDFAPGDTNHLTADPVVLAAKVALINRVDEVYNDDVAYKFVLVDDEDKLNFLTPAEMSGAPGPCGADACFPDATGAYDCFAVLERNDFVAGQLIGADNYDIGHIGLGADGGGVAGLGVVGDQDKGTGCTGIPTPVGDVYAIDYVAHEMGHQMGGDHTFDGPQGNCGPGNREPSTSVEPGSGTSIMAYAGICGTDDLQPHSDPYFSFKSIDEFEATTAESRNPLHEKQSVATTGLANGEQLTISCASGCTPQNVTFTGTPATDKTAIANAIQTATGTTGVTASDYDSTSSSSSPSTAGFTATWADTANQPTLTVNGSFTALVGTLVQGGPQTNGGTTSTTTDHSPVVTVPASKTIPTRTPFTLTGLATDADLGDTLRYSWEQTDNGGSSGTGLVNNNKTDGPLFRQFGIYADVDAAGTLQYNSPGENIAGTSPSRTFPDLAQVLAGNTNAATGTCPAAGTAPVAVPIVECYSEFLPTSAYLGTAGSRTLHFRLLARDNYTHGGGAHPGGVSWGDMALTVNPAAGPFLVTSRATPGTASGVENVTWNVAGTNTASMAQNVKISLSTDGGSTFPTVLADSTPNDGSQSLVLPSVTTTTARIKIEAVDNYFFDVNDSNFSINPAPSNVAPLVDAGPDATVTVNTPFTSTGSLSDETPATASATVDYGDGAGPQALAHTGTSYTLSHTYTTTGTKTVTVKATDAGALSGTDTVAVTVTAAPPPPASLAPSAVKASAKPKKITQGRAFKVKATVTAASGVPAGTVQVYKGTKLLGTGTLANGKVTIKLSKKKAKKLKVGKNTLTAKYLGSTTIAVSQADFVIKVKKKQ
jgi:hypothetical protein